MDDTIDYQIFFSILSIVSAIIGIILLFNSKYKIDNKEFINDENAYKINIYNRILLVIVFTSFLFINYNDYIKNKEKEVDTTSYKLQLLSSLLIVISTLISLYVAYYYNNNADLENPTI